MNNRSDHVSGSPYLVVWGDKNTRRWLEADVAGLGCILCHFPVIPGILKRCFRHGED